MKFVKHKNCSDVVFQRVHRFFSASKYPSEHWEGYWWTMGTTGMYRTIHDKFFVQVEQLKNWEDYDPKIKLKF